MVINKILDFIGGIFFDIPDEVLYYEDDYPIGEDVKPHFELGDDNE